MHFALLFCITLGCVGIILGDVSKKINCMHPLFLMFYIPVALNLPLCYALFRTLWRGAGAPFTLCTLALLIMIFYVWVRLHVAPVRDGRKASRRLRLMIGGTPLLYCHIYGTITLILLYCFAYPAIVRSSTLSILWRTSNISIGWLLTINTIYGILCCLGLFFNGFLRVICTSRRLSILRRIALFMVLWIPVVNLIAWGLTAKLIREEYDFAWEKKLLDEARAQDDICKTKYPLIMVHGIFFRDSRYFNYWGRIPRTLIRHGATIYYGNQEAAGTIAYNAQEIVTCVEQALQETGAEKVNIIAHSKGGLDSRYAASCLGLADHIASITTIGTPHRGCLFVDKVLKMLPARAFRALTRIMDTTFRKWGDPNPQAELAIRQFGTKLSAEFNETALDDPRIYYQSYASVMKNILSDFLLGIPFAFIKKVDGENDGLVSVSSAEWGEFKGVMRNRFRRGISHADQIDLKREDYKDFDVTEHYVQLVSALREKGL